MAPPGGCWAAWPCTMTGGPPKEWCVNCSNRNWPWSISNRNLELANLEWPGQPLEGRVPGQHLPRTAHSLELRPGLFAYRPGPVVRQIRRRNGNSIQNAHDSAKNLLNLINELLDTAKIEAGRVDLNLVEVDIAKTFADVKNLSQVQADAQKFAPHFQTAPGPGAGRSGQTPPGFT